MAKRAIDIYKKTDFDPEIGERICQLFSEGIEIVTDEKDGTQKTEVRRLNVTEVCKEVGISVRTLRVWLAQWPDFANQYQAAIYLYADRLAEEALAIADDKSGDSYVHTTAKGDIVLKQDWDNVNRSKLQVETRLKLAAKFHPEKYGDSLKINSTSLAYVIHRDETTDGLKLMVRNIIQEAKLQGYDPKEILAQMGLSEVNLLPEDFHPNTQHMAQDLLKSPQAIRIPAKYTKHEVQE